MRLLEQITEFIYRKEIAAEEARTAREWEHSYNERAARLFHQGNQANEAGRSGDAFNLWRLSGVNEARAENADEWATKHEGKYRR